MGERGITTMEPIVEFIEEEEFEFADILAKSAKKKKSPKKKKAKKAKKSPKKKKAGKKKAKKAKKAKKKKKKKKKPAKASRVKGTKNYKKGAHKSAKSKAAGKRAAAKQKAAGKGLFAAKSLSPALAGIVGKNKASRPEVTKAVWRYIKSKKLNNGRNIKADAKLAGVTKAGTFSMFKLFGLLNKHIK